MTRETLYDAFTNVKDELVDEAANPRMPVVKRRVNWLKWGSIAAAVVLVLGAGGWWTLSHWRLGASSAGCGGHEDGSTVFMSYAGPVFPLTALDGGEGVTAERKLTYDFSPWIKTWWSNEDEANSRPNLTDEERQEVLNDCNEWYPEGGRWQSSTDLLVTDAYTLENPTEEDRTVKLLYPFVSSLYELPDDTPSLRLDGAVLETTLHTGGYTGTYCGPDGPEDPKGWNVDRFHSWEDCKTLLESGSYQESAFASYPDLSDVPAIVYEFTDPQGDGSGAATIQAGFDLDYTKTMVLSWGFNGGSFGYEAGRETKDYFIPQPQARDWNVPRYLIVLGDDIQNITTQGYANGGCKPGEERDFTVKVRRYETSLEEVLQTAAREMYPWQEDLGLDLDLDFAMYFGLMKENLVACGVLSDYPAERYSAGMLEELDFLNVDRVFYLEAEVTVPAGSSITLTAEMTKEASYDYYCAHTENQDIYGYDMVTKLGSTLDFTSQSAKTLHTDGLEIVRQNYGFDWANEVNEVELDQSVEHYYLEVRRAAERE